MKSLEKPLPKPRRTKRLALAVCAAVALGSSICGANADDLATQRAELFKRSLKHPEDVSLAFEYAKVCVELNDFEGAIGALERVQFYKPNDAQVKAQLGLLYFRLNSHEMAKQYLQNAPKGELDAGLRGKVESLSPSIQAATSDAHAFVYAQSGVRFQSNAAFNPDNYILRLSNQDFVFTHPGSSGADWNGFQLLQAGYDYGLGNQRGDTIELRLTGYNTEQFRFTNLNVGFYDVSLGPRLALAPDLLPNWTVKPYVVGGQVFLAGARYLSSEGAGILTDMVLRPGTLLEPGVEVRHVDFNNVSLFSSLNSGTIVTASLNSDVALTPMWSFHGQLFYTRDAAYYNFQTSDTFAQEAAVTARFASPIPGSSAIWSISPYVKLLETFFAGANPVIDSSVVRHDDELQLGAVFDMPINRYLGLVTNVQYAQVNSNIPNYRLHNVSVLVGPTVHLQ